MQEKLAIHEKTVVGPKGKALKILDSASTITLSKKSSPGDGTYANGVKGGGGSSSPTVSVGSSS